MAASSLRLNPTDFSWTRRPGQANPLPWNRPPGLGQNCMSYSDFVGSCSTSGGGTGGTEACSVFDPTCIANAAAQMNACQAAFTAVPGNCTEEGSAPVYNPASGSVTTTTPSGGVAVANANTPPATAYGDGVSESGQPLSSYETSGLSPASPPMVVSSSAPPSTPANTVASSSAPPSKPAAIVTSSSAPPSSSSSGSSSSTSSASTAAASCEFALFSDTSCVGPIGTTTLLVLGGAAFFLMMMMGGRQ